MVLATQNPAEHHGTYPLPESQLDRFLMRIEVGYPDMAAEKEILKRYTNGNNHHTIQPVLTPSEVLGLQEASRKIHMNDAIIEYMLQLVHRTRDHPDVELGISPRGSVALFRAVQALALIEQRSFVVPDDVKRLAGPVFAHRLVMSRSATRARTTARALLKEILDRTPIPS
jgi:MoxR-like ATPase